MSCHQRLRGIARATWQEIDSGLLPSSVIGDFDLLITPYKKRRGLIRSTQDREEFNKQRVMVTFARNKHSEGSGEREFLQI